MKCIWLVAVSLLAGLMLVPVGGYAASADASGSLDTVAEYGRVTRVWDGDTVVITPVGKRKGYACRLYGIDAPETRKKEIPGQPYGVAAAAALRNLVLGREVVVELTGEQSYRRKVGVILLDGMDLNREMVRRGYAWAYVRHLRGPYASAYLEAEKEARQERRGLWRDRNPLPPWEFRRQLRVNGK